jgi:hypothetical protein
VAVFDRRLVEVFVVETTNQARSKNHLIRIVAKTVSTGAQDPSPMPFTSRISRIRSVKHRLAGCSPGSPVDAGHQ